MKYLVLALLFAITPLLGCGDQQTKTIRVRGVITLDDKPVKQAAVLFSPQAGGRPATGITNEMGEFDLQTFGPSDGALPGTHIVTITLSEVTGVTADPDGLSGEIAPEGMKVKWIVPERYSNPNTSGLSAEVKDGMQPLKFELTSS